MAGLLEKYNPSGLHLYSTLDARFRHIEVKSSTHPLGIIRNSDASHAVVQRRVRVDLGIRCLDFGKDWFHLGEVFDTLCAATETNNSLHRFLLICTYINGFAVAACFAPQGMASFSFVWVFLLRTYVRQYLVLLPVHTPPLVLHQYVITCVINY